MSDQLRLVKLGPPCKIKIEAAVFEQKSKFQFPVNYLLSQSQQKDGRGSGGIRTHASEETGALDQRQRLRPLALDHSATPGLVFIMRNFFLHLISDQYSDFRNHKEKMINAD